MTIQECYFRMGADYENVLRRLEKEERILRFLNKFLEEGSFAALQTAVTNGDAKEAFRAAHSLKGICLNLGLTALGDSAAALTEELRSGSITLAAGTLFDQVTRDYQTTIQNIRELLSA